MEACSELPSVGSGTGGEVVPAFGSEILDIGLDIAELKIFDLGQNRTGISTRNIDLLASGIKQTPVKD